MAKLGDHPGFKAIQRHIAETGNMPMDAAGAVLAKSSRDASPEAKRKNPRLNKVKGRSRKDSMTTDVSSLFKQKY